MSKSHVDRAVLKFKFQVNPAKLRKKRHYLSGTKSQLVVKVGNASPLESRCKCFHRDLWGNSGPIILRIWLMGFTTVNARYTAFIPNPNIDSIWVLA